MQLEVRGIPIHTRALAVTLRALATPDLSFSAYVLDLRKRGFVPVGGDLQGSGIIHHMQLEGEIDRRGGALRSVEARMPTVAFEAAPGTGGESCRDLIGRVAGLRDVPLDAGYARAVGAEIGGPRGCSHVLTLAQLVGPTAAWALREDARRHGDAPSWPAGERIFRRDVAVDGYESSGELYLVLQLADLHFTPAREGRATFERFAAQTEIRVAARLAMPDLRLTELSIAERRRDRASFEVAEWRPREDRAAELVGASLRAGISALLLKQFAGAEEDRPLLDALLMLAPATVQCMASFVDTFTRIPWDKSRGEDAGGFPDSCYMWRSDGALGKRRAADLPSPT